MTDDPSSSHAPSRSYKHVSRVTGAAFCFVALLTIGCGGHSPSSSSGSGSGPVPGESTKVAFLVSSTANDKFVHFNMTINQITLTNKAGATTTIFNAPTDLDFIPLNGSAAPLATVSIPQDVYTSAAISVSNPRFSFIYMSSQGGINVNTDAYGYTPTPPVITLAAPITVSGSAMGLTLTLEAAQSGSYDTLTLPGQSSYSINPTFLLAAFQIPQEPSSPQNGKCTGLAAQVDSIDNGGRAITVTFAGHPLANSPQTLQVTLNSSTAIQGIPSANSLAPGQLVDLDIALQPDTTYSASRIEVVDPTANDLNTGQLLELDPSYNNYVVTDAVQQQGTDLSSQPVGMGYPYKFGDTTAFQISGQSAGLSNLPFQAQFGGSTLAPGQMVSIGSTSISFQGGNWTDPTSITLMPQTIDATIDALTTSGSYTVYTVQLAPYDLIVQMNSASGAPVTYRLQNADQVFIYANSSTSMMSSSALGIGATFRFHGMLFNDGGVLRMAADQVSDGVPF